MKIYIFSILLVIGMFYSCVHKTVFEETTQVYQWTPSPNSTFSCDSDSVYFQEQVLPIFMNSCAVAECHDVESHEEDLILDSYENILVSNEIFPYDLNEGKIYEAITADINDDEFMPPTDSYNDALTLEKIDLIAQWINQGLPNNSCPDLICDTIDVTFSGMIAPMIEVFCGGCHGGTVVQGDVHLSTYNQIKYYANTGAIIGMVNGEGESIMPPNTSGLSDCQVRMIEMWIDDGTPNN